MKHFILILAMLACLVCVSKAHSETEPHDDAAYIAEALFNDEVVEVSFGAIGELMSSAMIGEFQKLGVEITPRAGEVIAAMLLDGLIETAGPEMRSLYADAYRRQYSDSELKAYRDFLETPSGQRIAAGNGSFIRDTAKRAESVGMTLGVAAAERMIENIKIQNFPAGTDIEIIKEIERIYNSGK